MRLYDSPVTGIMHTVLGAVSPMGGAQVRDTTGALFTTYEIAKVQAGYKTPLHAFGNLLEFAIGLGIYYLLIERRAA